MPTNVGGNALVPFSSSNAALTLRGSLASPKVLYLGGSLLLRLSTFTELEARYENSIFEAVQWQTLRAQKNLYRQTRMLYNPTRRLVDTYAAMVYPGTLTVDAKEAPDGIPIAMPISDDASQPLRVALAQIWQWTNMQSLKALLVRYGGMFGSVAVEVIDDVDTGKVCVDVWRPDYVSDVVLTMSGDVTAIRFAYMARDDYGLYLYEKEITHEYYATYRSGKPYDYTDSGAPSRWPNPYGFVPVKWFKHRNIGGTWGPPAIDGSINKIDQLNSLASQVVDGASKKVAAPFMIFTANPPQQLGVKKKRGPTSDGNPSSRGNSQAARSSAQLSDEEANAGDRETLPYWWAGGVDGHVEGIGPTIMLADAMPIIESLIKEIEEDHPELTLWRQLRGMSTVTGPAAERLVGDAANRILETASEYDVQMVKLHQMAIAIAGWRANGNGWGTLNSQQQKFAGFGLDSYKKGDIDFSIKPRPLIRKTTREQMDELLVKSQAMQSFSLAGMPFDTMLQEFDYTPEQLRAILKSKDSEMMAAVMPVTPPVDANGVVQQ